MRFTSSVPKIITMKMLKFSSVVHASIWDQTESSQYVSIFEYVSRSGCICLIVSKTVKTTTINTKNVIALFTKLNKKKHKN